MTDVLNSLEEITTGYNVFEKNQVLTHEQLNQLGSYLDDQDRLTRVALLGVGVGCGLRPTLVDFTVQITKGVGVTTDGDLFRFGAEMVYDRFKPYDEAAPAYPPFFDRERRVPIFELIRVGVTDARAVPLENFGPRAGFPLSEMVVVLFMESYVRDPDLCSGTDCDNLGKDAVNIPRVLLIHLRSAVNLQSPFDSPDSAARALAPIVATRAIMRPENDSVVQVNAAYRAACDTTLGPLRAALGTIYPRCRAYLSGVFASDPAPVWQRVLDGLQAQFAANPRGLQYYYDFLLDLVATYTDFRALLFGDTTICAPDFAGFPKHLLLGRLARDVNPNPWRTRFYPSPVVSRTFERVNHARFLAKKINTLILTFEVPQIPIAVRITPSQLDDRSLEDRAIPHYYKVNDSQPIHRSWNHRLERQGMSTFNYSYNAALYGAQGGAANPLTSPIAPFRFFRIEGHLGRNVQEAVAILNREIRAFNLPIAVQAVMLDPDRTKLPWRPPFRVTDLHRWHYLLRNDIASQLEDAAGFSGRFKGAVDTAITLKTIQDDSDTSDSMPVHEVANSKNTTIKAKAGLAVGKLTQPYQTYKADTSWKADVHDTLESAAQFKSSLGKVVKTEFSTPFDNLIASSHIHWLPWLEDIIKKKDEKEESRVLFGNFLTEHPGLEHCGGAPSGGTFVLAHDTAGTVVADFSLSYFYPAPVEEQEDEPPLVRPGGLRPPFVINDGIRILPSREKLIADKLDLFKLKLDPEMNKAIDFQKKYFDAFKDSISLVSSVYSGAAKPTTTTPPVRVKDPTLDSHLNDTRTKMDNVDFIRNQLLDPNVDTDRQKALEEQLKTAEVDLAKSMGITTKYVAESAADVSAGSDGFAAMAAVSDALARVNSKNALAEIKTGLTDASGAAAKPEVKNVIAGMLRGKGIVR